MRLINTLTFLLLALPLSAAELKGLWVTSSGSVDTSSPEAIVKCLVKPGMTGEQKALAVFNWYRRVIYPHNYMGADRRDVLRQINSYGCTLCGSHAANLGWLMRTAGFKMRCAYIYGGGHTFIEVFYDDAWHALDPETDFAVWSRTKEGEKPHLISMEELKADPTLLDKAIEEGRAKQWFFKAMQHPFATRKKMAAYCDENKLDKMGMQWSSCVIKDMTIKDYFVEGVKTFAHSKDNEPNGGTISDPNLMKLSLRPGEMLTRCWDNEGKDKFIRGQGFQGYPAHFMAAGEADEDDTEVFPFVEPYRKDNYGIPALAINRCYRYSGNGHNVWSLKNAAELATAEGVALDGVAVDKETGSVRPAEPGKAGSIIIPFRSSYALVGCHMMVDCEHGADDTVRVSVKTGKDWTEIGTVSSASSIPGPPPTLFLDKAINGQFNYQVKIELAAKDDVKRCVLKQVLFNHTFVNNWPVLPYLVPGKNTIRVRLDNPDALKAVKLVVRYEWAEGPDWKTDKFDEREVTAAPFEYTLDVAGPKYPRMKRLILAAATR